MLRGNNAGEVLRDTLKGSNPSQFSSSSDPFLQPICSGLYIPGGTEPFGSSEYIEVRGHKVKFHLAKKSTFPRASRFIAQVLSTAPRPSSQAKHTPLGHPTPELLVEPVEHWKFGGRTRNSAAPQAVAQPPPLQYWECTVPKTTPGKLGRRSS